MREGFTGDDDITCKINLSTCIELHERNELVEELFNMTRKLDRFDELIYELKNNVFLFTNRAKEYLILK